MGYIRNESGRLCCDNCGWPGAKKVRCPHKVKLPFDGGEIPYCAPPALCDICKKEFGGTAKIHGICKKEAISRNEKYREEERRLTAGDAILDAAFGDWHKNVPKGMVGRIYRKIDGTCLRFLFPKEEQAYKWAEDIPYKPRPWPEGTL